MPFTEQQLIMMGAYSPAIADLIQEKYKLQIDEEERRRKAEMMAHPTQEELDEALEKLQTYSVSRETESPNPPRIILNPQPFYVKFLNKRNKRR